MQHYLIYEIATGYITGHSEAPEAPMLPDGYAAIDAEPADPYLFYVVDGDIVPLDPPRERPTPPSPPVRYTFNQWVDRFPFSAQVAIVAATATDPVAKLIYDRAMSAGMTGSIDPADPRTAEGVSYLVGKGYITQAEANGALAS